MDWGSVLCIYPKSSMLDVGLNDSVGLYLMYLLGRPIFDVFPYRIWIQAYHLYMLLSDTICKSRIPVLNLQ